MPIVFYSSQDIAGKNIALQLRSLQDFREAGGFCARDETCFTKWVFEGIELIELDKPLINADYLSEYFQSDLFMFASRHKSEAGVPALTVHSLGNWGKEALYGGKPRELCLTSARAVKSAFDFLTENKPSGFDASLESTHHGPTSLKAPSIFVELGSSEKQWLLQEPAQVVAQAIIHCCKNYAKERGTIALGFGGTHYCSTFNKLVQETDFLLAHIAPKHALNEIDSFMAKQAIEKTSEKVSTALIDWKGCNSAQRSNLLNALEENRLDYERV